MNEAARIDTGALERRRITLRGLVQGVGFRPHVYRCAERFGVAGSVANTPEGVIIEAEGDRLDDFLQRLQDDLPPLARIDSTTEAVLSPTGETGFRIAATTPGSGVGAAVPSDTALCADCLRELFDPANRRYLHPFIACCNCGPRYTMTRRLPYDRASTAMADFALCRACEAEYDDPQDRRFHAEPVACHDCGPRLSGDISAVTGTLAAGGIVAIKGVGGYHLACDARRNDAVERLRTGKQRDGKPFAVMVLNAACAARYARLDEAAVSRLAGPERPVVIAPTSAGAAGLSPLLGHAGLGTLGMLLPYTAVHYLLFHSLLGKPAGQGWLEQENDRVLVMTSANVSGEPLIVSTDEAERRLGQVADRFLHHDRDIPARADDSVLRTTSGGTTLVRRARGYAPHAVKLAGQGPRVLALGPFLKNTVTLAHGERAYLTPHVGDLETPAAVAFHAESAQLLCAMLGVRPELLACDLSPDFPSTHLAERLSEDMALPLVRVQHHHAHVAAVLAEHGVETPALGLALDGHGYGVDGASWGGELLLLEEARFERLGHLAALPLPGGDRAASEPWRMAAGVLHRTGRGGEIAARFPEEAQAAALARWLANGEVPVTTAAGRLFDAAAGLLGVCHRSGFEGEAPMRLEGLLDRPIDATGAFTLADGVLDFTPLLAILADCTDPARGAAAFHGTLVQGLAAWVTEASHRTGIHTIALGGGCFHNNSLAQALPAQLEAAGLAVLQARNLPPNDGAVSLGQAWIARRCR